MRHMQTPLSTTEAPTVIGVGNLSHEDYAPNGKTIVPSWWIQTIHGKKSNITSMLIFMKASSRFITIAGCLWANSSQSRIPRVIRMLRIPIYSIQAVIWKCGMPFYRLRVMVSTISGNPGLTSPVKCISYSPQMDTLHSRLIVNRVFIKTRDLEVDIFRRNRGRLFRTRTFPVTMDAKIAHPQSWSMSIDSLISR